MSVAPNIILRFIRNGISENEGNEALPFPALADDSMWLLDLAFMGDEYLDFNQVNSLIHSKINSYKPHLILLAEQ